MDDCDDPKLPERISRGLIDWGCGLAGRFSRLKRPGTLVTLALVAAYGVVQVLKAGGIPNDETWQSGSGWLWVYGALAALATIASLLVVIGYRALLGAQSERDRFNALAHGVVRVVETNTSLLHHEIGVNIWVIQGVKGFRRLERHGTAVAQAGEATPITWVKGKGVIGRCWARNRATFADLEELRERLDSRAAWCAQPRDRRFRFSWREFQDTRRFKAVLAVPLRARDYRRWRVRGVLAIDVRFVAGKGRELEGLQENAELSGIVRTCQAVLARGSEE